MKEFVTLGYAGPKPGADTGTTTLYDSTAGAEPGATPNLGHYRRYLLSLQNTAAGTLKVSSSRNRGAAWDPPFLTKPIAGSAGATNELVVPVGVHVDIKVEWTNGGVAQTLWVVEQGLDDGDAPQGVLSDSSGSSTTTVTSTQLPAALGQATKAQSLSVVDASDSDRAPLRNEVLVIPVTATSVTFNIPDGSLGGGQPDWRGKTIEAFAELGDCYLQFSTSTNAVANEAQASTLSTVSGRQSIAPQGDEAVVIPRGMSRRIAVLPTYQSFALKGTIASSRLRTQPA